VLTRSNRTEAAVRTFKRGKLLCGVCSAALALAGWLSSPASADSFMASDANSFRTAIMNANASSDVSSTITLTNSFALPSSFSLPMPTKSITIDTQGFVLTGANGVGSGSITFVSGVLPSVVMTVNGTLVGGNSAGIGNPGAGLSIQSLAGSTGQVVNNGSITGGNATVVGKYGAVGAAMFIDSTLVNNGTITGGVANAYVRPAGSIQGSGVSLNTGSSLINNAGATVLGGNSQGLGAGAGLYMDATGGAVTATNYGTIRGGSDLAGAVAGNAAVRGLSSTADTSSLTNFGLLEGATGAAAISSDGSTWNIIIVNGGIIRAGAGQSNAIVFGQTAASTSSLELRAGSIIQGNVIGNALGANTLILGGDDNASFDVSTVGPQYQSFTSFQKTGNSTWSLTGTGTVATPWVISQGTLQIGDGTATGSIIGDVTDNANLAFNRSDVFTFGNTITGTGSVTQVGTGTTILTGTSTYTGPTTVTGGTLSVNGSIATSAVTVASGGTLGGHGTVGATTVQSGGNVAPGNSIGTLHINGAFAQNSGSVYQVEVDPTSNASDLILVNGTATIADGATMNVTKNPAGDYRMDAQYTVLTASGGVIGSYALIGQTAVTQYLALQEQQDANNIYLRVIRTSDPADAAQTGNQAQTATGTDSLPNTSNVGSAVLNTPDPGTTRSAFDALSGEAIASAKSALISGSLLVRDTTFDRLRDVFCASDETSHRNRAGCPSQSDKPTLWAQGFGSWGHVAGNGNAAALSESVGGFLVGVDMPIYDWRVGYFGGFSRTDFDVKARSSSGNSNNYHLGMYGGTQWGDLGLRLGASYSWSGLSTDRSVVVGDLSNGLRANYNAGTTQVFGELGQRFAFERFTLEPFANVAYVNLRTDGFSETGGDAALTARADTTEDTFTTLGVRPSTDISWGSFNATARGMAGWRHAFGDVTPSSTVSFAGSDAFTVSGVPIARDAGVVEAGLDFAVHGNVTAGLTYGGQFSSRETDHSIRGNFAITF
jgi:outer membrane autotransporter protein